jgi:tRNA-dihydrouridine synthase
VTVSNLCGVVVSNHGGRQLNGAVASLHALPDIADAVGDRATVLIDSGVRTGSDVVTALALGADAVMIGRPYIYGLAVAGCGVKAILGHPRQRDPADPDAHGSRRGCRARTWARVAAQLKGLALTAPTAGECRGR